MGTKSPPRDLPKAARPAHQTCPHLTRTELWLASHRCHLPQFRPGPTVQASSFTGCSKVSGPANASRECSLQGFFCASLCASPRWAHLYAAGPGNQTTASAKLRRITLPPNRLCGPDGHGSGRDDPGGPAVHQPRGADHNRLPGDRRLHRSRPRAHFAGQEHSVLRPSSGFMCRCCLGRRTRFR